MNFKNILYATACLSFSIIVGAAIYEHTAVWSAAFSELPKSLTMFQGDYKLQAAAFWKSIHPITFTLLVITLVTVWKTERKKYVLGTMIGYALVLGSTFIYFVPELLDLTATEYSSTVDPALQNRANLWVTLSLLRGGLMIVIALALFLGLTKTEEAVYYRTETQLA